MRPKTFLQLLMISMNNGCAMEQIALRKITMRLGVMRWTYRLMADGLWHVKP